MQVFKRFPLLHVLQYLAAPVAKLKTLSAMEVAVRDGVLRRIDRRGNTEHVDLFDYVLPVDRPVPSNPHDLTHTGALAQQMMFANYGPISDWYYGTILFLLDESDCMQILSKEIRDKFESYHDITPNVLASLPYLHACLEESLRLLPSNNTGLPRLSPGGIIDGHYVPKGVSRESLSRSYLASPLCQSSTDSQPTDPCPNQYLRTEPQLSLLPRSDALPATALASFKPSTVRDGLCE